MPLNPLPLRTLRAPVPVEDEARGEHLAALVRDAVPRRSAAPVALVFRGERVDLADLREVSAAGVHAGWFLATLTRAEVDRGEPVGAVGMMGVFTWRRAPADPGVPTALVFVEWPDGRWWQWKALLRPDPPSLLDQTETIARAVDGLPRPDGLGGWWTHGRVAGLRATLSARPPVETAPNVH